MIQVKPYQCPGCKSWLQVKPCPICRSRAEEREHGSLIKPSGMI